MAAKRAVFSLLALLAVACDVEEPTFDIDAGTPDATVVPDSGVDSGVSEDCILDPSLCDDTEFCGPDATCEARARDCSATSECGPLDVCLRPLVPTSTVTEPGACVPTPGGCATDADCATGVCLAVGVCGPRAARATLEGTTLVPRAACVADADCGFAGVCTGGICGACRVNEDCAGGLLCTDGVCSEPSSCVDTTNFTDCFAGNACSGSRCIRATDFCVPDSENDAEDLAQAIEDGAYEGLSICGDDEDWYALSVPSGFGVQVVLTSNPAQMTAVANLYDSPSGNPAEAPSDLARLDLPGLTVLRLPSGEARMMVLRVSSADTSGDYAFSVRYTAGQCGDDEVEIYGTDLAIPTNVVFEGTMCPNTEERRTFAASAGDELQAQLEILDVDAPAPSLALLDPAGAALDTQASADAVVSAFAAVTGTGAHAVSANAHRLASAGSPYRMRLVRKLSGRDGVCANPERLNPAPSTIVRGDLSGAIDLGRPDCTAVSDVAEFAESSRHDLLYAVAPPTQYSLLRVALEPVEGTDPQLSVAVLSDCESDTSATACEAAPFPGSDTGLEAVVAPGEQPIVVVSSDGPEEDVVFEMTVEYLPIASFDNDLCADATPLTTTGTRSVVLYGGPIDAPWGARNDTTLWEGVVSPQCSAYTDEGLGVDRFYTLTLAPDELAAVELSGPFGGMLWTSIGAQCTDLPRSCTQAEVRDYEHPFLRATFTASTAGTHHVIVVDGAEAADQGSYVLRTVRNAECLADSDCEHTGFNACGSSPCRCDDYACAVPPDNDDCASPATIAFDAAGRARIAGSTGAATADYTLACEFFQGGAPDVVYELTVEEGVNELVARIVDATFDPMLELRRGACRDEFDSVVECADDVRYDIVLPELHLRQPAPGLYYLIVGAYAGRGAFTLDVEVR